MRIYSRSFYITLIKVSGIYYPSPTNTTYLWNSGFLAFVFLILQMITGIILAMFYNPHITLAYESIMFINNEVYYGWLLKALHANGASFFFLVIYIHMARGMYYGSYAYPRHLLWVSGVIIWAIMIATAFLGYVLPWGQMSFWAAMVITTLLSAIPLIGNEILYLLWGGFSLENVTLHRFYSLHYMLPFIIMVLSLLHFIFLHEHGSTNPLGINMANDMCVFIPYYLIKDVYFLIFISIFMGILLFIVPDVFSHPDNYNHANFLVTPNHIIPEWYFLPLYAVLRSVTNKLLGIFLILMFILSILLVPFILHNSYFRSAMFKPLYRFLYGVVIINCIILGWIGGLPVMDPFILIGQIATLVHFLIMFVLIPGLFKYEQYIVWSFVKEYNIKKLCY